MPDAATGFVDLPDEFRRVLALAEEQHAVRVTPLEQLSGGWSGAVLFLVSVAAADSGRLEHCVLKLDRRRPSPRADETQRHRAARAAAPADFAEAHIPDMAFDPVEHDGAVAIFYRIAGESLRRYRPLSSHRRQRELAAILAGTTTFLLDHWNAEPSFQQAVPPQDLLRAWLGFRLKPGSHLDRFLREQCRLEPDVPGFLVVGRAFRNPLAYARDPSAWAAARPLDVLTGFQHGDLNTNNILLRYDDAAGRVDGYSLIDFAAFEERMPLLYDLRYLEMSYLLLSMARVPFASTAALMAGLGDADLPDPYRAPVETAGPAAVLAAARDAFGTWVDARHPTLHDDLWAQYWLAGVAAGLAYCHKPGLGEEQRLAGLLYASANLERYAALFALPGPAVVRQLIDEAGMPANRSSGPAAQVGSGLPLPTTPLIGREPELRRGAALLTDGATRLVTLTGPGGMGKTRLGLQLAADLTPRFADGVRLVDLAPVRDRDQVLPAVASAVGVRQVGERPVIEGLEERLRGRSMLLLLDNFEQVVAAAPAVADLLARCPGLTLLVTSREALHLRGEHVLPVPPLSVPDLRAGAPSARRLAHSDAVRFFVDRARAVQPDFRLTDANADAVGRICSGLDGLPLAIELAAARIPLLSPEDLLARLGRPLEVLHGGARDLPARQQALRDTIAWSHGLLNEHEQRLFALLSVFSGCTLGAVEAVAEAVGLGAEASVLDDLTSLLDKSLLRPADRGRAAPRLTMLETIRSYARERLAADPEAAAAAREAHARHFASVARASAEHLRGSEREATLRELEADVENLRSAWNHWVAAADLDQLQAMTQALWSLDDARGWHLATAALAGDLLRVLAATPSTAERAQQEILLQTTLARVLLATRGYTREVEAAYTSALELCEQYGDVPALFPVLRGLSSYYAIVAEFEKGARLGEQILQLAEQQDDPGMRVEGHLVMASCVFGNDPRAGLAHLERAIAEYDPEQSRSRRFRFGNDPGIPIYTTSALVLWMLGFPEQATERADRALALAKQLQHPFSTAYAAFHVGLLELWRRDPERALQRARDAIRVAEAHDLSIWRALGLCLRGAALADLHRPDEGLADIDHGMALYGRLNTPPVFWPLLLHVRATAFAKAGRHADALAVLGEALPFSGPGSENPMAPEIQRLKGELVVAQSPEDPAAGESWFVQSIEIARARDARTLELRAATDLSRLRRAQGREEEGRQVLAEAYGRLTEGFDTPDARIAAALLTDLTHSADPTLRTA